jgi:hypothetical protein
MTERLGLAKYSLNIVIVVEMIFNNATILRSQTFLSILRFLSVYMKPQGVSMDSPIQELFPCTGEQNTNLVDVPA